MLSPGTHDWNKYISPEEMERYLDKQNTRISIKTIKGMVIRPDPFQLKINWHLAEDTGMNYILHAVKGSIKNC